MLGTKIQKERNFIVPLSAVNRIERTMGQYTYVVTDVVGKEGHHYPLLTSNEYPWMNIQIIPTPDEDREREFWLNLKSKEVG